MTFTQALLVIVGLGAVAVGLVCYHLLSRLDLLERSVMGGLEPPGRRLSRLEFEQRFERSIARSQIARHVQNGLVIVLGDEVATEAEQREGDIASAVAHLDRGDGVTIAATTPTARKWCEELKLASSAMIELPAGAGVSITPFVFVVDSDRITQSRAVPSTRDLLDVVRQHT